VAARPRTLEASYPLQHRGIDTRSRMIRKRNLAIRCDTFARVVDLTVIRRSRDANGGDRDPSKKGSLDMSPQPHGICRQCNSIWRDYSHATAEHLRLLLERDMATARRDWEVEDSLNSDIPMAERRRGECREQIRQHENRERDTEEQLTASR